MLLRKRPRSWPTTRMDSVAKHYPSAVMKPLDDLTLRGLAPAETPAALETLDALTTDP